MTDVKSAPKDRYRAEVRHVGGWTYEARVVTVHTIRMVGERGEPLETIETHSFVDARTVLGERWALWKARRMVAAARRRDVREGQPWVI